MLEIVPVYLHPHEAANEPVTLYEGRIVLRAAANETVGRGRLVLRFVPSTGVRLEADIISGTVPDAGQRVKAEIAGGITEALINSVHHGMVEGITSARIEASVSRFEVGSASELAAVGFQILNFADFLFARTEAGTRLRFSTNGGGSRCGRLAFPPDCRRGIEGDLAESEGNWRLCLHAFRTARAP